MSDRSFEETRWTIDEAGKPVPPPLQAEFIRWLTTPKVERDPPSQAKFAEKHGISEEAMRRWKRNPKFQQVWQEAADEINLDPQRLQDVIGTLATQAIAGDPRAAKLYLEYAKQLAPQRLVVEHRNAADLSDAELRAQLADVAASLGLEVVESQ